MHHRSQTNLRQRDLDMMYITNLKLCQPGYRTKTGHNNSYIYLYRNSHVFFLPITKNQAPISEHTIVVNRSLIQMVLIYLIFKHLFWHPSCNLLGLYLP